MTELTGAQLARMLEKGNDLAFQQTTDHSLRGVPRGRLHVAGDASRLEPERTYVVAATDYELESYGQLIEPDWSLSVRYDFPTIIREAIEEKLSTTRIR